MAKKNLKQKSQEEKLNDKKTKASIPDHKFSIEFGDKRVAYFKAPSSPMIAKAMSASSIEDKKEMYRKGVEFLNELFVGGDDGILGDEFNLIASFKIISEISDIPNLELEEMTEEEKGKAKYKLRIGEDICLLKGLSNEQKVSLMFSGDEDEIYTNSERAFVENFIADPKCFTSTNFVVNKEYKVCGALFLQSVFEIQEVNLKKKS